MSVTAGWIAAGVGLALLLGLLLMLAGQGMRQRRGLGAGRTVSLDQVTLTSRRYGLTGRPDRMIRQGETIISAEWKSSRTLRLWHRAQMGVYFLLIEHRLKVEPPHGFVVCRDGTRHRIDNTDELRAWVLDLAGQIRAAQARVAEPLPVHPRPGQCRQCGMRGPCGQAGLRMRIGIDDRQPFSGRGGVEFAIGRDEGEAAQADGRPSLMQLLRRCQLHGVIGRNPWSPASRSESVSRAGVTSKMLHWWDASWSTPYGASQSRNRRTARQ